MSILFRKLFILGDIRPPNGSSSISSESDSIGTSVFSSDLEGKHLKPVIKLFTPYDFVCFSIDISELTIYINYNTYLYLFNYEGTLLSTKILPTTPGQMFAFRDRLYFTNVDFKYKINEVDLNSNDTILKTIRAYQTPKEIVSIYYY